MTPAGKFSFSFAHWGGSPKRLLAKSQDLSDELVQKFMDLDSYVRSSDPSFGKMLKNGEKSWILTPIPEKRANVLIASTLVQEHGRRPLWHFLAVVIKNSEIDAFSSVKQLVNSIFALLETDWWDFEAGKRDKFDIAVSDVCRDLEHCSGGVANTISRLYSKDISYIRTHTVACNPSVMENDWEYVINTANRNICTNSIKPPITTAGNKPADGNGTDTPHVDGSRQTPKISPPERQTEIKKKKFDTSLVGKFVLLAAVFVVMIFGISLLGNKKDAASMSNKEDTPSLFSLFSTPASPDDVKKFILKQTGGSIENSYEAEYRVFIDDSWQIFGFTLPGCCREFAVCATVSADMLTDLTVMEIDKHSDTLKLCIPTSNIKSAVANRSSIRTADANIGLFRSSPTTKEKETAISGQIDARNCTIEGTTLSDMANRDAVTVINKILKRLGIQSSEISVK